MFTSSRELRADYSTDALPKANLAELQELFGGIITKDYAGLVYPGGRRTKRRILDTGSIRAINYTHRSWAGRLHPINSLIEASSKASEVNETNGADLTAICAYVAKAANKDTGTCPNIRKPHSGDGILPEELFAASQNTHTAREPFGIEGLNVEFHDWSDKPVSIDPIESHSDERAFRKPFIYLGNIILETSNKIHELPESVAAQAQALGHLGIENSDVYWLFGAESAEQLTAVWQDAMTQTAPRTAAMRVQRLLA